MKTKIAGLIALVMVGFLLIGNLGPAAANQEAKPLAANPGTDEAQTTENAVDGAVEAPKTGDDFKNRLLSTFGGSEPELSFPSDTGTFSDGFDPINPTDAKSLFEMYHGIDEAWAMGYTGENTRVAVVDTGVDFAHIDLQGTYATVTNTSSPYHGWPIAFDPDSMGKLINENTTKDSWYANTSRHGTGPFKIRHTIEVDGTNDFFSNEEVATDPKDDNNAGAGGDKHDFDLTNLYVTRDENYWYLGLPTYPPRAPESYGTYDFPSFGVYLDVDGGASGTATVDPMGNNIDTLTSHSNHVTDVVYSPDGALVATASKDKTVKIWEVSTGNCIRVFSGYDNTPWSLDWSADGNYLVTADRRDVTVWNANTGAMVLRDDYINIDHDGTVGESFYGTNFAKTGTISISSNSTWVAISTKQYIYIYDIVKEEYFGKIYAGSNNVNSVAFHPTENWIAVGGQDSDSGYYPVNVYDLATVDYMGAVIEVPHKQLITGGHQEQVVNLAWHPTDPNTIASVCKDIFSTVIIWDVGTESVSYKVNAEDQYSPFLDVEWSHDGAHLVTTERGTLIIDGFSKAPAIVLRDSTGTVEKIINRTYSVNSVSCHPTQNQFVVGSNDRRASFYDFAGTEGDILIANRVNYAIYFSADQVFSAKDQAYEPVMLNATFHKWNGAGWDQELPLNNITWPITGETLIATYSVGITEATFSQLSNFAHSSLVSYQIYKNGAPWEETDNYTVDLARGLLSLSITADISDGDVITADYVYRTPGAEARFQSGEMLFNEFAIPRFALGDPASMRMIAFTAGRDNSTPAQDTVPSDIGVIDFDYNQKEDKGLNLDTGNSTSLGNFVNLEVGEYSIDGITSISNNFHFGMHPSEKLSLSYGGLGILVVDSTDAGVYDTVYMDMNNDRVFDPTDVKVNKANPVAYLDNFNRTANDLGDTANRTTPDGYPDVSAGMLYFISDGVTPLPYSERYCQLWEIEDGANNKTPSNGALICLMGEFTTDAKHGTMTASRLVSSGELPYYNVSGICPDAKVIAIGGEKGRTEVISSWYFAVEGYDGAINSGDDAHIVVNGFDYPSIYESGWDDYSRMADYISMTYANGSALFVMPSGNGGSGYGTVTSPGAAPGVLTVGPATDYYYLSDQAGGSEGVNHHYGDLTSYGSKGPTAQGLPKPDCVAIASGFVDLPLNLGTDGTTAYSQVLPWSGSDHSCAVASGIAILVYQAYHDEHGEYPTASIAKNLLMSGCDDIGYDILSQGAGFLNAERSTMMAANQGGLSVSRDNWVPGDYKGVESEAFTPIIVPGQSEIETIGITNHGTSSVDVEVSDFIFDKTGEYTFSTQTSDVLDYQTEMGAILGATLNVRYSAGSGYAGTLPLRWSIPQQDSGELQDTDIYPGAGDDGVNASFNLFDHGVNSIEKVSMLCLEFNNTDPDDDSDSSVSFDVVNITVKYAFLDISTDAWGNPYDVEQHIITFDAVPDRISPQDNTTDDLNDVQNPDAVGAPPNDPVGGDGWYTVARNRVMFFNEFDMSPMGVNEQTVFAVTLEVRYSVDDGYSGTNSLMWSLDNGAPYFSPIDNGTPTTIVPSAGQVGHTATFDLYGAGVTSVWNISRLNLFFENNDGGMGKDSVSFDYIGLEVKYRGLNAIQANGMPLTSPPWPAETVETVKLKCNKMGAFDTAKDLLSDIQIRDNNGPTPGVVIHGDGLYTITTDLARMHVGGFESVVITPETNNWHSPEDIVLWLNGSGLHTINPQFADVSSNYPNNLGIPQGMNFAISFPQATQTVVPAVPGLWENADMVRITAHSDYSDFSTLEGGSFNYAYSLKLQDWGWNESYHVTEMPAPYNKIWETPVYFPCTSSDASYGMNYPKDLNTIEQTVVTSNVLEMRLSNPSSKVNDSLVINLQPFSDLLSKAGTEWHFTVEFFEKADWSWLKIDDQEGAVGMTVPGSGAQFTVTASVPHDIGVGSYQGGIQIKEPVSGDITTIPVLINVASLTNKFEFGGACPDYEDLYNNTLILGGYDLSLKAGTESRNRPYTGDRRFYFFDIANQGIYANADDLNYRLVVESEWGVKPSDMDILHLSQKRTSDEPAVRKPARYGSCTLENKGGSEEMPGLEFFTNTNTSKETIATTLTPGFNALMLRGTILDGSHSHETVTGRTSEILVSQNAYVVTPDASGTVEVNFHTSAEWEGLSTSAVGPAVSESMENVDIKQDYETWWNFPNWGEWNLRGSFTWWVNLSKCMILEVHIQGHDDASDLDLAVFQDLNGDGELTLDEVQDADCINYGGSNWMYDADADADEKVTWVNPPDGPYIIKVIGFTTSGTTSTGEPGGHFDLTISQTLDTGSGYEILGTNDDGILITEPGEEPEPDVTAIPAYQTTGLEAFWNFPGTVTDGDYGGAVMVGTIDAPGLIVIPMRVSLDREAPVFEDILPYDGLITGNPRTPILASFKDAERGELRSASLYLDGKDITILSNVNIPYDAEAKGEGYVLGSVIYEPNAPLADGLHKVDVVAWDWSGNKAMRSWMFTVDTTLPDISLEHPTESVTVVNEPSFTILGTTDRDSEIRVMGAPAVVEQGVNGDFKVQLELAEGDNIIYLASTDGAGNKRVLDLNLVLDTQPPVFNRVIMQSGSVTNKELTSIYGEMSETGRLLISGMPVPVNSDGSFEKLVILSEGQNTLHLEFTDLAGNTAHNWQNVTLDTVAPSIKLTSAPTRVTNQTYVLTGSVESGTRLYVNGYRVVIPTTRQSADADFEATVKLSPGPNVVHIEARDSVGNVEELRHAVYYDATAIDDGPDDGGDAEEAMATNWAAIGIMVLLLVVGLILGLFLGPMIFGGKKEELPEEEAVPSEEAPEGEEIPEGETPGEAVPAEEELPDEEQPPEEAPEGGETPEGDAGGEAAEELAPEDESLEPEEPAAAKEGAEPIPEEESVPEELSPEPEEDPRIAKLTLAYESGKISKELYEKNLAKFKGQ